MFQNIYQGFKKKVLIGDRKEGLNKFYYLKILCVTNFSLCVNQTLKKKVEHEKKIIL